MLESRNSKAKDDEIPHADNHDDDKRKSRRKIFHLLKGKIFRLGGFTFTILTSFALFYIMIESQQTNLAAREMVSQQGEIISVPQDLAQPELVDPFENENCELMHKNPGAKIIAPRRHTENGPQRGDKLTLGRCTYFYPNRFPPKNDHKNPFLGGIDFYFMRKDIEERERCFLHCIDLLDKNEMSDTLLVAAATMGLTEVVKKLKTKYGLDPLAEADFEDLPRLNAIQAALRGGYAEIVSILSDNNVNFVVDHLGRTVKDWVNMKASPILPHDAKKYLNIKVRQPLPKQSPKEEEPIRDSGWYKKPDYVPDNRCDIDVTYGTMSPETFYNDYWLPGRPFVIKRHVSDEELAKFDKSRWETTESFNSAVKVKVGPTAYPFLTGQESCEAKMSIQEIEDLKECREQPGVPMLHARHPHHWDWKEIYPMYDGDVYHPRSSWHLITDFFDTIPQDHNPRWQLFFGGDDSGATLHWHPAAFNALFTGMKEWALTPPFYRGYTGMPARDVTKLLQDTYTLRCTQKPGDMMYIPDDWGHMTLNRGFAIGAAVILPPEMQQYVSPETKDNDALLSERAKEEGYYYDDSEDSSDERQKPLFFVHINKAGGTSMIRMLQERCPEQYVSGHWGESHRSFHASATSFIDYVGKEEWDNAASFAVVRHPLARQVSCFFFLMEQCTNMPRSFCDDRLIPTSVDLRKLSDETMVELFHDYVFKLYEMYPPGSRKNYLFGSRGHGNEEFSSFNATQTSWLVDENDEIVVQHIFHLENLSKDMSKLTRVIPCLHEEPGIATSQEEDEEMVHMNETPSYPDYELFTKNEQTNSIIKEVYSVDFKNFGYTL